MERDGEKACMSLWAKKNDKDGQFLWLPLMVHLQDTMDVADFLWNHWLSIGQREWIISQINNGNDIIAERLVRFLAGIHDIGKATPAFQTQKGFSSSPDLDEENIDSTIHSVNPEKKSSRYPVVTLVLYFGHDHRWRHPVNLKQCLEIPDELDRYVSDYRINLFEIAWLTDEQVNMFRSDFKIVADYFVQIRKNKKYEPSTETITHVREILNLMSVLTNDDRFEEAYNNEMQEGGHTNMCEVLDEIENRGKAAGIAEGKAVGLVEGMATGREESQKEIAVRLYQMNMPENQIAVAVGSDIATVHMWLNMDKNK